MIPRASLTAELHSPSHRPLPLRRDFMPRRSAALHVSLAAVLLALATGCSGFREIANATRVPVGRISDRQHRIAVDSSNHEWIMQIRAFRVPDVEALAIHAYFFGHDPRTHLWTEAELDGFRNPDNDGVTEREIRRLDLATGELVNRTHRVTDRGYTTRIDGTTWVDRDDPVIAEWRGKPARRIFEALDLDYRRAKEYSAWPGPNSNTYVHWVLRQAGVPFDPHPLMVGKDHRGPWGIGGGLSPGRLGVQLETPLLGAAIDLRQGIELHTFCLTWGIDLWPPAIKTPFGRWGFSTDAVEGRDAQDSTETSAP